MRDRQGQDGTRRWWHRTQAGFTLLASVLVLASCNKPNANLPTAGDMVVATEPDDTAMALYQPRLPYTLAPGDQLEIKVFEDEALNASVRIDYDGGFQFHYAGRVKAEGLTTMDVSRKITTALAEFYVDPHVSVNLLSQEQQFVNLLGEIARPGRIALSRDMSVIDALAEAGGPTRDAALDTMVIIRRTAEDQIVAGVFDYREATLNPTDGAWASNITLQRGDTIYLPRSNKAQIESIAEFVGRVTGAATDVQRSILLYPDTLDVIKDGSVDSGETRIIVR